MQFPKSVKCRAYAIAVSLAYLTLFCGISEAAPKPTPKPTPKPVIDKQASVAHYEAAVLGIKEGKLDYAETEIEMSSKADPNNLEAQILHAQILARNGHYAESQDAIKPILFHGGNFIDQARLAQGEILLLHREFTRSLRYYSAVLDKTSDPLEASKIRLRMLYCDVGLSDWLAATKLLVTLKPSDPKFPGYYFGQAALSLGLKDPKKASDSIQTARTLYGNIAVDDELGFYLKLFDGNGGAAAVQKSSPEDANPVAKPTPTPTPKN